jgi:hypothetical protein
MSNVNVNEDSLPLLLENVAGIDIGPKSHFVALPPGEAEAKKDNVREFPAHSVGLAKMAEFLKARNVSRVAMAATGIYWVPARNYLRKEGIDVCVVGYRAFKRVPGRKSGLLDCQWMQRLFACGVLSPLRVPDDDISVLREYDRVKARLAQDCARCILRMEKALRLMNIQLDQAVNGVADATWIPIVEAILGGERDAAKLAEKLGARRAKSPSETIPYLTGVYVDSHLLNLRLAHNLYARLLDDISLVNGMIYGKLKELWVKPGGLGDDCAIPEAVGHAANPEAKSLGQIIHACPKGDLANRPGPFTPSWPKERNRARAPSQAGEEKERQRQIRELKSEAAALGLTLVAEPAAADPAVGRGAGQEKTQK